MKKIVYALLATVSGLVLLFSYRTSLDAVPPATALDVAGSPNTATVAAPSPSASETSSPQVSGTASSSTNTGSSASSGLRDGVYTGTSAGTRYGPVRVRISVSSGQIADVQVIDYPQSNGRDQAINQRAIPLLVSETTRVQGAQISMVSGATYTSRGYLESLQSAIDQARS